MCLCVGVHKEITLYTMPIQKYNIVLLLIILPQTTVALFCNMMKMTMTSLKSKISSIPICWVSQESDYQSPSLNLQQYIADMADKY